MKKRPTPEDWLPLAPVGRIPEAVPTGEAFKSGWIDFERGIRVGNLEPHERITRILKHRLEERYGTGFVTDRWGRGVHWQWICWLPRANREAKPVSNKINFGCAKFFISIDRTLRIFQCGLQVERGFVKEAAGSLGAILADDWDWHRLMAQCAKATPLDLELRRLLGREGFIARLESEDGQAVFSARNYSSARQIREAARKCLPDRWAGFQLFYSMSAAEVRACNGYELVLAICGAFAEVTGVMNMCMQVPLAPVRSLLDLRDQ